MLRVENVVKVFDGPAGAVRALDEVSLRVDAGQLAVIRGPSGCGKTTLLLAAGTLLRPDQGLVLLDDDDPYAISPSQRAKLRARRIGFVFQQFHLVPYLSVRDNVRLPGMTNGIGGSDNEADKLIERFGLSGRSRHLPEQLSTGERQRVALARAMVNRPSVILADEPTGNLDPANAETILVALAEFADAGGCVLLAAHDSAAHQYAHKMIDMNHGKIESIPHAQPGSQ